MTERERTLLHGVKEMEKQAPTIGICSVPFMVLRCEMLDIISEREDLASYREPMRVNSYKLYAGQCPRCGAVFLDSSANYCGNCGQALDWGKSNAKS